MPNDRFWIWFTVARTVALLVALVAAGSSACEKLPPPAPPFSGKCEPAEYTRGQVSALRCAYEGRIWLCHLTGERASTCTVLEPYVAPPAESLR